jgi:pimeloyl-ACP methyl ester carboxylesterase
MQPAGRNVVDGNAPGMADDSGHWVNQDVAGHRCEIFEPSQRHAEGFVLIYLHGVHLASLQDKRPFVDLFERFGLSVVAPCAGPTWWTDRICQQFDPHITAEQYLCRPLLDFIEERWSTAPPRIGLFGTSMGAQGALRISYKHPQLFPVVAALSPAIDFQIRYHEGDEIIRAMYPDAEAVRQDTAILYVHPLNWPRYQFFCCDPQDHRWIESAERLQMKLQSLGIPHQCDLETEAGGHGFPYYNAMAERTITFLVDSLSSLAGGS